MHSHACVEKHHKTYFFGYIPTHTSPAELKLDTCTEKCCMFGSNSRRSADGREATFQRWWQSSAWNRVCSTSLGLSSRYVNLPAPLNSLYDMSSAARRRLPQPPHMFCTCKPISPTSISLHSAACLAAGYRQWNAKTG